jgi:hypothetical protein
MPHAWPLCDIKLAKHPFVDEKIPQPHVRSTLQEKGKKCRPKTHTLTEISRHS